MAFDQTINYKVRVDDSDFQAKLSQLRASMDMSLGAGSGFGGGNMAGMLSLMNSSGGGGGYTNGMMQGLADFGAQVRPVTYTPAAIAMQPHFGMFALQQTGAQTMFGAMGMYGLGAQGAMNFMRHPFSTQPDIVPPQVSMYEYMNLSARSFGNRLGDAASTAALVGTGTLANLTASGIGASAGQAMFGGLLGGLAGGIAGGAAVSMVTSAVGDMMAQNRAVQTQLEAGSFRFITGGKDVDPLTGRGFSRRARAGVADFIQSEELHDVRFGMGEMKEVLEGGMQLDLFSGTGDVESFKGRFKGLVSTLKTIMSTLHSSAKEGMEVMRGMQDMGITDPGQMGGLVLRAETMGRMAGKTGMEMMALGQTGAELFRGTGVSMQVGFEANMQNVAMVRGMLNQGTISRETVAQAGGENGLAQQMTASALASTQTAVGRGLLMANFSGGALSPNFQDSMNRGGIMGVMGRAAGMTPGQIMSFQAHEEEAVSSLGPMGMQLFGIQSGMMQAKMLAQSGMGIKFDDAFVAMQRRAGVPINVIREQIGMMHTDPEKLKDDQQGAVALMGRQSAMEDFRNSLPFSPKAISNYVRRTIVQPIQREFTGISTAIGTGVDNFMIRLQGGSPVHADGMTASSLKAGEQLLDQRQLNAIGSSKMVIASQVGGKARAAADGFQLSNKDFASLEGLSSGAGFRDIGNALFGGKFSESDETQIAILDKVLHSEGRFSSAEKQFSELHGKGAVEQSKHDATALFNKASQMRDNLSRDLTGHYSYITGRTSGVSASHLKSFSDDSLLAVAKMARSYSGMVPGGTEIAIGELRKGGAAHEDIQGLTELFKGMSASGRERIAKETEEMLKTRKIAEATGKAAGVVATGAAGGAGGMGEVTGQTLDQMRQMSDSLVKNMEMLIALQKEFNKLQGSR